LPASRVSEGRPTSDVDVELVLGQDAR
jgi:hypothetical protein